MITLDQAADRAVALRQRLTVLEYQIAELDSLRNRAARADNELLRRGQQSKLELLTRQKNWVYT